MEESSEQLLNSSSNSLVLEILKSRFESLVEEKMKNVDSEIKYLALAVWIKETKATLDEKKKAFDHIKTISIADEYKLMVDKLELLKTCDQVSITNSVKNVSEQISINYSEKSMDLDSISIFIRTEGLLKLLGMRAALASSTQYLRDDVIGDYCNIFDGVFVVKIPFVKKELVTKKLFERGIEFCPSEAEDKRIATERVWVSTIKIIEILHEVSIDVVRIIGHGLKEYNFSHFFWEQFLWYDPTNRFDFARNIECEHFNLYDSYLDYNVEVYPLFGTDSGTLKFEKGFNKIKVYNTFIHALKNRAKLKFRLSKTMTYRQMGRIIEKIQRYMKLMKYGLPTSTRIEITIHQNAGIKFSGLLMQADIALCEIEKNLTPSRIFTKKEYLKQIEEFGLRAIEKRYFNGRDSHVVSQSALKKLKYLYKIIGISEHPKKGRFIAQSPEDEIKRVLKTRNIIKRDKKGRFQRNLNEKILKRDKREILE